MIRLITTGGTIAEAEAEVGRAHWNGQRLLSALRALGKVELPEVEVVDLMDVPSTFLGPQEMYEIGAAVRSAYGDVAVQGVVITHGTATLEETAYFTELLVDSEKPIVFTGALLTPDVLGYDGSANLWDAISTAASPSARGKGVLVAMHGEIHAARDVVKGHPTALDAFRSPEFGPLGRVTRGRVRFYRTPILEEHIPATPPLARVDLLTCYAGMSADVIRAVAGLRPQGLVLQAMGSGTVPPAVAGALGDLVTGGIVVVATTRCAEGRVEWKPPEGKRVAGYAYHLKELGVVFSDLPGLKARLKLIALLSAGATPDQIEQRMVTVA